MRRFGDRWAGTRVIDTEGRLTQLRQRVAERLFKKKGVQLINPVQTPLSNSPGLSNDGCQERLALCVGSTGIPPIFAIRSLNSTAICWR